MSIKSQKDGRLFYQPGHFWLRSLLKNLSTCSWELLAANQLFSICIEFLGILQRKSFPLFLPTRSRSVYQTPLYHLQTWQKELSCRALSWNTFGAWPSPISMVFSLVIISKVRKLATSNSPLLAFTNSSIL